MNRYQFSEELLLRAPVGNPERYTLDIDKIMQDKTFLSAVAVSSPQFYGRITSGRVMNEKVSLVLRKYYNRFCFRPTPFGLFSSISESKWGFPASIPDREQLKIFISADNHLDYLLRDQIEISNSQLFEPNPTLYTVQQEHRFISMDTDVRSGKRQYLLQATDRTVTLERLLLYCKDGRSDKEVKDFIEDQSGCNPDEAIEYLTFLKISQVLLPVKRASITGQQPALPSFPEADHLYAFSADSVHHLLERVKRSLPKTYTEDSALLNVICMRERSAFSLLHTQRNSLNDGLWALAQLTIPLKIKALEHFAGQFNTHFEGRSVPLLNALDPETGIAYGAPEKEKGNLLLETLNIFPHHATKERNEWTSVHRLLLNAWHDQVRPGQNVIDLDEDDLKKLGSCNETDGTAGFGILFRTSGKTVWIDSAGGYHTNALLGRFTIASEMVRKSAKEMAEHEQQLNPAVVFAEILHLADLHTDNVNRRARVLEWEIPVTASSGLPKDRQLALSDLDVSVEDGKVVLRSRKLGLPVIPRLTSAYNHGQNDLPLFRFLADLPYQYAANLRTLDLTQLFPGLNQYPRVIFKNAVLSPAQWVINANEVRSIIADHRNFHAFRARRGIPEKFLLTEGDQQLIFDSSSDEQLRLFFECSKRAPQVRLQEVPVDPVGMPVSQQYNAFVLPDKPLRFANPRSQLKPQDRRRFMPGSEWLYLKLYTTKLGADALLRQFAPYLKRQLRNGRIVKWFFVRFDDHAPHLRLRLMADTTQVGHILVELRQIFERKLDQNVIREYQVDTYNRELERYGVRAFEDVEDFFHASSMLILGYLTRSDTGSRIDSYLFGLVTTRAFAEAAFPIEEDRLKFYERCYHQFEREFSGDKIYVELDKKFRSLRGDIEKALTDKRLFSEFRLIRRHKHCIQIFNKLTKQVSIERYEPLVSSLIHMHLNRLFIAESRKQEMIIYYFLYKYTVGKRAVAAKNSSPLP